MMKCKYCGGNLTLEQAYCPHCGRPNEEAAQHVKDMEHYKSCLLYTSDAADE